MKPARIAVIVVLTLAASANAGDFAAWEGDNSEWGAVPASGVVDHRPPSAHSTDSANPSTPPLFGDFGGGGFNFGGFSPCFNFGGGGFQGGFAGGGFQGGGFQGGFQGGFGGGGFQGGFGGGFQCGVNFAIAPFRGAYKIGEGESPRPQNRLSAHYTYYEGLGDGRAQLHREIGAIEKTFLDGQMSVGFRLPGFQGDADGDLADDSYLGDLSIPIKVALWDDPESGSLISGGLMVTVPTGTTPYSFRFTSPTTFEEIHPVLIQPFVGYIWQRDQFFIQGFSSLWAPTDSHDVTAMFNDMGMGYRIPVDGLVQQIVPVLEAHVNTPLNHRTPTNDPGYKDAVNLNGGVHIYLTDQIIFGAAVGTTVTGPRLFDYEVLSQLSILY